MEGKPKGAAGVRCRQLDGRAAILLVVARSGDARWQARLGDTSEWRFSAAAKFVAWSVIRDHCDATPLRSLYRPAFYVNPGHLARIHSAVEGGLCRRLCAGGRMLWTVAVVMLVAWLAGVLGLYDIGDVLHVLLLVGLMLLVLAGLGARDAAAARRGSEPADKG
jgi:hypothetical protein